MDFSARHLAVYAITDRHWLRGRPLAAAVEDVIAGGATCIQLREKTLSGDELEREAREVQAVCRRHGVPFIVNDDVALARRLGADGVHLGQHDLSLAEARRLLGPDAIIGVSAKTVAQAVAAERGGASYLGTGAVFPTSSKADATAIDHRVVKAICAAVRIPVVTIGGITPENLPRLAGLGAAGIAGISMFFAHDDGRAATAAVAQAVAQMLAVPPSPVRAALFDLDGTLLDSLPAWSSLAADFLARHGLALPPSFPQRLADLELWEAAQLFHDELIPALTPADILRDWLDALHDTYFRDAPLLPHAEARVRQAIQDGFLPVILTSTDRSCAEAALARTGLAPLFAGRLFTTAELLLPKRSPDIYWHVIGQLGATLADSFLCDDSPHCRQAAQTAGLQIVSVD